MNQQHHIHEPEPEPEHTGAHRTTSRRRWWAVGLASVAGLALTTAGVAATPAADAIGRTLTTDGHSDKRDQPHGGDRRDDDRGKHDDGKSKNDRGKGKKEATPKGTPVPCDADALIAAIVLANARDGAVLDLADNCTYLLTADLDGNGLPVITAPITLNGGKNTTIERAAAVDEFRIITVDTGGNLTLNKLKITGGHTDSDGGGILVNPAGTLTTNHSTITRNIAEVAGGGIANNGTTTLHHSTVSRNTAGTNGGGIFSTALLNVKKSNIANNTASASGAGIHSNEGRIMVEHSRIAGNQTPTSAGGVELFGGTGTVTKTEITNNTAMATGGILANSGQLTLRNVIIANNTATSGLAGGLSVDPGTTTVVEDSIIKNNTAGANGGGVFNFDSLVLRDTKVIGNQSGNQGGGIVNGPNATLSLFDTQVVKNIAVTDGGGIFNSAGVVNLNTATGTIVIKNRPNNCVDVPDCAG